MDAHAADPNVIVHVRVVLGMVVSLGMARLLTGVASFVQHPGRERPDPIHLLWVASMLLLLLHFWWWEFELGAVKGWSFGVYAVVLYYAVVNFLLCALLFPTDLAEYAGYRDYFLSRRRWFFGLLAMSFTVDAIDTWLKGPAYVASLGVEFHVRLVVYLLLCAVAAVVKDVRFHIAFALANIIYQVSFIVRRYDVLAG